MTRDWMILNLLLTLHMQLMAVLIGVLVDEPARWIAGAALAIGFIGFVSSFVRWRADR
jgi:hypothetical protein